MKFFFPVRFFFLLLFFLFFSGSRFCGDVKWERGSLFIAVEDFLSEGSRSRGIVLSEEISQGFSRQSESTG